VKDSLGSMRLKLLLDQNLSRKLVPELAGRYPGTSHVLLLGMAKTDDSDIWRYARHHGYTLVSKNTDMVDLLRPSRCASIGTIR
jgi:predicted nuclease of predicted toxin-antitoxin system